MKKYLMIKNLKQSFKVLSVSVALISGSGFSNASELIFDAEFDEQPDWQNSAANYHLIFPGAKGDLDAATNLPGKFDSFYTSEMWNENGGKNRVPTVGAQPSGQITDFQARREGGKSFVVYDESWGSKSQWGSDAQLGKDLFKTYEELWVEFYIKFQKDWVWMDVLTGRGQTMMKLFRARYVPENYVDRSRYDFFGVGGRAKSPVYLLDLKSWTGEKSTGEKFSSARLTPAIRGFTPEDLIGVDENYFLKAYEHESSIKQGATPALSFAEVFQTGKWVKVNILIRMDSTPGAGDGAEEVWINDVLEKSRYDIPFRRVGEGAGVGFNWFSIGGNAHNYPVPEDEHHEQWYAITDLKIYDSKPEIDNKPNPPSLIRVE